MKAQIYYLSGAVRSELYEVDERVGFMLTPRMGNKPDLTRRMWGADTGCFSMKGARAFDRDDYLRWLDGKRFFRKTNLFVTAPDVIPMHLAAQGIDPNEAGRRTLELSLPVMPILRQRGWPVAFVAQNGSEHLKLPWELMSYLFIGGDDEFKLGGAAAWLVKQATMRGIPSHLGRVNSKKRFVYSYNIGCLSADGTFVGFGPDKNIPRMLKWFEAVDELAEQREAA